MIDLNFPVSLFRTYVDPSPIKNIPLLSFFTITSESLQKKVLEIRELKSIEIETGISQKKKIKSVKQGKKTLPFQPVSPEKTIFDFDPNGSMVSVSFSNY